MKGDECGEKKVQSKVRSKSEQYAIRSVKSQKWIVWIVPKKSTWFMNHPSIDCRLLNDSGIMVDYGKLWTAVEDWETMEDWTTVENWKKIEDWKTVDDWNTTAGTLWKTERPRIAEWPWYIDLKSVVSRWNLSLEKNIPVKCFSIGCPMFILFSQKLSPFQFIRVNSCPTYDETWEVCNKKLGMSNKE